MKNVYGSFGETIKTMSKVQFTATKEESDLIDQIVARYNKTRVARGLDRVDVMSLEMDIEAVHCNGCRLDLVRWLAAGDFHFIHDISGITNNIDRNTGKLMNNFDPRFSMPEQAKA